MEAEWQGGNPGAGVIRRNLGTEPLPSTAWANALAASSLPADQQTPAQAEAAALAATLTDELLAADTLLLAIPLYNFGVS